jgi:small subunit ribosomal protein S21e
MDNTEDNSYTNYEPRKCTGTNKIIISKDYSAVQIKIAQFDKNFRFNGKTVTYILCGNIRKRGHSDKFLNKIIEKTK